MISLTSYIYICDILLITFVLKEVSHEKNDSFFTLQRHTVTDFWFVELGAILKTLTFYKQIFSNTKAFPVVVNRCTFMLCSMQYAFFL